MHNELLKQICAEAGAIKELLDKTRNPEELNTGDFENGTEKLVGMLGKVNQELVEVKAQEEEIKKSLEKLSREIKEIEKEIDSLQIQSAERGSELEELREIKRQLDLPEARAKIVKLDELREEVRQLQEEKERVDKEIAPLQEEKDQYENLNNEITQAISNRHDEEIKINDLNEKIAESKKVIERLSGTDFPGKENQKNKILLHALRLAIKAKQKNMYTPGWDRLMALLALDAAKEENPLEAKNSGR